MCKRRLKAVYRDTHSRIIALHRMYVDDDPLDFRRRWVSASLRSWSRGSAITSCCMQHYSAGLSKRQNLSNFWTSTRVVVTFKFGYRGAITSWTCCPGMCSVNFPSEPRRTLPPRTTMSLRLLSLLTCTRVTCMDRCCVAQLSHNHDTAVSTLPKLPIACLSARCRYHTRHRFRACRSA